MALRSTSGNRELIIMKLSLSPGLKQDTTKANIVSKCKLINRAKK